MLKNDDARVSASKHAFNIQGRRSRVGRVSICTFWWNKGIENYIIVGQRFPIYSLPTHMFCLGRDCILFASYATLTFSRVDASSSNVSNQLLLPSENLTPTLLKVWQ